MVDSLTPEQITEFKEAFFSFENDEGRITIKDLVHLTDSLGQSFTEDQLQ